MKDLGGHDRICASIPVPSETSTPAPARRLSRALGLWDLVFIGIIMVQPTAPMTAYGVFYEKGAGHVVTTILIAMTAMLFTAISYGRMASVYPSAGSAYAYVGQELHPTLGFATGWSMLMDYVLNPLICVLWCSRTTAGLVPAIPFPLWVCFFAGAFAWTNLRRIRATARINEALTAVMGVVIVAMLIASARYVFRMPVHEAGFFTRPFYDPERFSWPLLRSGTAVAVLTYLGFDGVSTLSEEAKNPKRNILLAMVLTCLLTGLLSAVEVYAAQLVWPAGKGFLTVETAYIETARLAGGAILAVALSLTLLVANFGSGSGAQLSGARLLYGMGRSGALPTRFFAHISERSRIPSNNVLLISGLALAGSFVLTYEQGAELINFGALLGFMGVNLSAFRRFFLRNPDRRILDAVAPLLGFTICAGIWWNLADHTKLVGFTWLAVGLVFAAWRTGGFKKQLSFDAPSED